MLSRASGLVYGSRVPEEGRELVLEVSEGIEIVEEDREHPLDNMAIAAEFDAARQRGLDPIRPRHDGVELVEQLDFLAHRQPARAPLRLARNSWVLMRSRSCSSSSMTFDQCASTAATPATVVGDVSINCWLRPSVTLPASFQAFHARERAEFSLRRL
jgi:hypothetical protein